ncbi:winged helix DNA-binding domain-containing protein [Kitasatospora sp. NPDC049258]|uniref:winged helix DNA-binding domain-containing protein n=1 Tax=Kitasatospora sp. NPDC049258 TaxID=3155394 RepID=UPI00343B980F
MTEEAELLRWRMHAQFAERPSAVAEIARRCAGVQAQDAGAVRLALRARGLTDPAAVQAAYRAGEVVASWLMRGTLHLVPAEEAAGLLALYRERLLRAGARRRRELGLTEELCARALAVAPGLLDPPPSRAELIARLREHGVPVEPTGQAPAHLTAFLAAHGVLCRGADVTPREPGYRPVPPGRDPAVGAPATGRPATGRPVVEEAVAAELARRYLGAFGPAAPADLAAWSGLPVAVARRAFAAVGATELRPGLSALPGSVPPPAGPPLVRLLGGYDNFLLGYRSREPMLDAVWARRINAGGGVIRPALVADGRVLGTWRKAPGELLVEPFEPLPEAVRPGLAAEVEAVGAFLAEPLALRLGDAG